MRKIVAILLLSFAVAGMAGCKTKETSSPAPGSGKVIATAAYEKYFGGAPSVDKGTAYAFVIYFPSAREPGKVVPFPFFTFDEGSIKKVAIERLLAGMDIGSYQGEFVPFPGGIRLMAISEEQGTVIVNFSKELEMADATAAHALALTLRQFKGVKDIRIQVIGKESTLNTLVKNVDDRAVRQPSPPRLLSVTAMRGKGAKEIEDVNAFFDRPVEVKELKLLAKDGQPFAGDLYHSVFDMAAVLKPKDPLQFREHMPIRVRWKVVDKLGRLAEGDNVWLLEVKEH
ncbi:GerMN domain-containing protein [Geobacter sp. AOG1]|uniref:GerMN domain-containing protein n=1 Tax=Geobacter sp. AOG1 TaxID=1566346 RepID=UPI001CC56917|nr:GerMN domain-containing protein [Geobacter sp. AOG1]GFE58908.1 hypothetical protein AOG1_27880 [Geobacter sp. AOG1]